MTSMTYYDPTPDMFFDLIPPRRKPRIMMHVCDATDHCCGECEHKVHRVRLRCSKCGTETGWRVCTLAQVRRGIPCERCNSP